MSARRTLASGIVAFSVACGTSAPPAGGSTDGDSSSGTPSDSSGSATTSTSSTPTSADSSGDASSSSSGSSGGVDGSTSDAIDMGGQTVDPCTGTAFCEHFDDYDVAALVDDQEFGPWRASVSEQNATMDLDGTHTVSGERALHVRLEQGVESGGRLFTNGDVPLLADAPTHVYGRMMMYIGDNGTSVHWTFFGVQGPAEASSPHAGSYSSYIMSSLPRDGVNTYSFVDGLSLERGYQDCSTQGMEPMPSGQWTCVSFEMDSVARHLRMWTDGNEEPIVSVDEHGNGCVPPAPADSVWYGPEIDTMFVGSWSFHDMNAPLEVWIDDLVVDTVPVACP